MTILEAIQSKADIRCDTRHELDHIRILLHDLNYPIVAIGDSAAFPRYIHVLDNNLYQVAGDRTAGDYFPEVSAKNITAHVIPTTQPPTMDIKEAIERKADIRCDNNQELARILKLLTDNGIKHGLACTNKKYPKYVCIDEDDIEICYNPINSSRGTYPILSASEITDTTSPMPTPPVLSIKEAIEQQANILCNSESQLIYVLTLLRMNGMVKDILKAPATYPQYLCIRGNDLTIQSTLTRLDVFHPTAIAADIIRTHNFTPAIPTPPVMIDEPSELTEATFMTLLKRNMETDSNKHEDFMHDCIMKAGTNPGSGFFNNIQSYVAKQQQPTDKYGIASALAACIARDIITLAQMEQATDSNSSIVVAYNLRNRLKNDMATFTESMQLVLLQ